LLDHLLEFHDHEDELRTEVGYEPVVTFDGP
jgi:hypothetical protein